jgi:hypothetical protein
MTAVVGYLVAASIAIVAALTVAGPHHVVRRDPTFDTAMAVLPIAATRPRLVPILADRWHLEIIAYAEGAMVLVGFLLLSVLGLA